MISSRRKTLERSTSSFIKRKGSWHPWRAQLHDYFDRPNATKVGRTLHYVLLLLILTSLFVMCLETLEGPNLSSVDPEYPYLPDADTYFMIDAVFAAIFTMEIVLRAWTAPKIKQFFTDTLTWFDLAAVLPFYVHAVMESTNTSISPGSPLTLLLNFIELFRVLRVVKMARHFFGTPVLVTAISLSIKPLMITLFFLVILAMIFATILFYAEPCTDLETCPFTDIFNAGYFVTVTVTTVGFGDQVPGMYNLVSLFTTVVAVITGSLFLSMPLAIIGNMFLSQWAKYEAEQNDDDAISLANNDQDDMTEEYAGSHCIQVCLKNHMVSDDYYTLMTELDVAYCAVEAMGMHAESNKECEIVNNCMSIHQNIMKLFDQLTNDKPQVNPDDSSITNKMRIGTRLPRNTRSRPSIVSDLPPESGGSLRSRLWLLLEVPDSSRAANIVHTTTLVMAMASIALFYSETIPEFHSYGPESGLCKSVTESYCYNHIDDGCNNLNSDGFGDPINFGCADSDLTSNCYGVGLNFGSVNSSCYDIFNSEGREKVCDRRPCDPNHITVFDAAVVWPILEWFFGILFTAELVIRFFVCRKPSAFFKDAYNVIDAACIFPFYIELYELIVNGILPTYAIAATDISFLELMKLLKTFRILKLTRHFSGTSVLVSTLKDSWKRLTIPLFFLFIACLLFGGVFYEIERGKECFVGQPCLWNGKDVLTPEIINGALNNTRILVQNENRVIVKDMLVSTWLALVTFTSVGYGRVFPRTALGKFIAMIAMIFGACYTAMPLTLVGVQFYRCYCERNVYEDGREANETVDKIVQNHRTESMSIKAIEAKLVYEYKGMQGMLQEVLECLHPNDELQNADIEKLRVRAITLLEEIMILNLSFSSIINNVQRDGKIGISHIS